MATIINGKEISATIRAELKQRVNSLRESEIVPGLAVILVGDDPASAVYVRNKTKACNEVGIQCDEYILPATTSPDELYTLLDELNRSERIDGILVQSPLPKQFDYLQVIDRINPEKDVDAFHPLNVGKITIGKPDFLPCTPAGIMELLHRSNISPEGKNCVVIGRSNIVGKPMSLLLLAENGTVTVCHSKTPDLSSITQNADILVSAVGKAKFIKADMLKEGVVVIDVGMNRDENGKLCGDVDFDSVISKVSAITPVPGGVGPMTITMLLANTIHSAEKKL